MINVEHLTKTYVKVTAVRDVSFDVGRSEVVGFLGPNGAGKSTTLRIIAGSLGATRGTVRIDGADITDNPLRARQAVGYMPENVPLYNEMRVIEYLRFRAKLKGIQRAERATAIERAMSLLRIDDHAHVVINQLSKGYRQRLGIADALLAKPQALVLDEPTAGLDPNQIVEVRELIRSLAKNHAVLLSTHIMSEVEATCDRAVVIHQGQVVAQGSLDTLRQLRQSPTTRITLRHLAPQRALDMLASIDGAAHVAVENTGKSAGDLRATEADGDEPIALCVQWALGMNTAEKMEQAVDILVRAGARIRHAAAATTSIEQVFALLTAGEASSARSARAQRGAGES